MSRNLLEKLKWASSRIHHGALLFVEMTQHVGIHERREMKNQLLRSITRPKCENEF